MASKPAQNICKRWSFDASICKDGESRTGFLIFFTGLIPRSRRSTWLTIILTKKKEAFS